ncbi:MAG: PHP domain-containing protein [Armatimonadetes bacterium]|nr:PHP domain-containing protein [Armatimonadota bacterium]
MRIDLHTHTTASDGLLSPTRLIEEAVRRRVGVLAVTDHDTTDGVDEAMEAGRRLGVEVIPGVELNTDVAGSEVHILGYYIDHRREDLQRFLRERRGMRWERARQMVVKLNGLGMAVDFGRVLALAHDGSVGRPHVARALIEAGHVASMEEAFRKYIGRNCPAYVERVRLTPFEAVAVIRQARGIPVMSHPGPAARNEMIPALVEAGLEGIEAYYPEHSPGETKYYLSLAERYGLVVTGGSDFHGADIGGRVPLGSQYVPAEMLDRLKARAAAHGMLPAGS